jgi:hypothetical protein
VYGDGKSATPLPFQLLLGDPLGKRLKERNWPADVEKVRFPRNPGSSVDRKCPRKSRTLLVEPPDAILFLRIPPGGVFQQPRLITTVISCHISVCPTIMKMCAFVSISASRVQRGSYWLVSLLAACPSLTAAWGQQIPISKGSRGELLTQLRSDNAEVRSEALEHLRHRSGCPRRFKGQGCIGRSLGSRESNHAGLRRRRLCGIR